MLYKGIDGDIAFHGYQGMTVDIEQEHHERDLTTT